MKYQVMPDLTPLEYEALKADIAERGVLVPVETDENGDLLDGHHRVRAWQELRAEGVNVPDFPRMVRSGLTEEQKRNHARSLNVLRRQLTKEQRDQVMIAMVADGMSRRMVAEKVGVDEKTVRNVLANSPAENSAPEFVNGRDGKTYPAQQQPKPEPPISMFVPGSTVVIDHAAAESQVKQQRKKEFEEKRAQKQAVLSETSVIVDSGVWCGDMRELGTRIADSSVDLILTDPPYPGEFLPLFSDLSALAARVLKPGGLCLVYSGQIHLPEVMARLTEHLEYVWTFAIRHSGGAQRMFKVNVNAAWKPVIALVKPPLGVWWDSFIDVVSGGMEKELHEWQQAESEAAYFIEHLSLPGQVVVDPFCGSGTVLSAAKSLGRQYQGIELDAGHAARAAGRLM